MTQKQKKNITDVWLYPLLDGLLDSPFTVNIKHYRVMWGINTSSQCYIGKY